MANIVRMARRKLELDQKEFAKHIGYSSQQTISEFERESRGTPKWVKLLCEYIMVHGKISPQELDSSIRSYYGF